MPIGSPAFLLVPLFFHSFTSLASPFFASSADWELGTAYTKPFMLMDESYQKLTSFLVAIGYMKLQSQTRWVFEFDYHLRKVTCCYNLFQSIMLWLKMVTSIFTRSFVSAQEEHQTSLLNILVCLESVTHTVCSN